MVDLDPASRALGLILGVGDVNAAPACSGYQHGCPCPGCKARAKRVNPAFLDWLELGPDDESDPPPAVIPPRQPPQPWETEKAA